MSRPLWRGRMVVIADRANPRLVDGRLTMADLAELWLFSRLDAVSTELAGAATGSGGERPRSSD